MVTQERYNRLELELLEVSAERERARDFGHRMMMWNETLIAQLTAAGIEPAGQPDAHQP